MAQPSLISELEQLLRQAGLTDDDIHRILPVAPNPPWYTTPDECRAVALADKLADLASHADPVGACHFHFNNKKCTLNTTQASCTVLGNMYGGSSWDPTPEQQGWV
jgi:hypothetical protein